MLLATGGKEQRPAADRIRTNYFNRQTTEIKKEGLHIYIYIHEEKKERKKERTPNFGRNKSDRNKKKAFNSFHCQ
jgi:hypothetical protein